MSAKHWLLLLLPVLWWMQMRNAQAQAESRMVITAPRTAMHEHLRLERGISDAEYRQQMLDFVPLGSTYREVEAFVLGEIKHEKNRTKDPRPDDVMPKALVDGYGLSLKCFFHQHAQKVWREQPPYMKLSSPDAPFTAEQGKTFIHPSFYDQSLWRPVFGFRAVCVFDKNDRLIDVFVHNMHE